MGSVAFRWSLIGGIAVFAVVILLVEPQLVRESIQALPGGITLPDSSHGEGFGVLGLRLLGAVLLIGAGLFAGREAGLVTSGAIAGVGAVLVAHALTVVVSFLLLVRSPLWGAIPIGVGLAPYHDTLIQSLLRVVASPLPVNLVAGLACGLLGAVFGSRISDPDKHYDPLVDPDLQPGFVRRRFSNSQERPRRFRDSPSNRR